MGIGCMIFGCGDMELTGKQDGDKYEAKCSDCGNVKFLLGEKVCESNDCPDYVIGINYLTVDKRRHYSQRCYRCPRCGNTWHDDDSDLLEGKWFAIDGKAVHSAEMNSGKFIKIPNKDWLQIKSAASIREVRKIAEDMDIS
jgi:hypothetical protein